MGTRQPGEPDQGSLILHVRRLTQCIRFKKKHLHVTQEHSEVILPNESGDVGLTASSSSPSDLGAKNGEICASAIPHENADALK